MKTKKKRSSPQFATIFGKKFVGSFSPGWLFFLWSSSAQLSMRGRLNFNGGTLNLDGGTLTLDGETRPPVLPLQFKYWSSPQISGVMVSHDNIVSPGAGRPPPPSDATISALLATPMALAMIVEICLPFRYDTILYNRSYCCCSFFFNLSRALIKLLL